MTSLLVSYSSDHLATLFLLLTKDMQPRLGLLEVLDTLQCIHITANSCLGIRINGTLIAGFLNSTDLRLDYRATVPYISNPFVTMGQTSVEVARRCLYIVTKMYSLYLHYFILIRFTSFGGPSLYVSFLGMETLQGPLSINVTFDRNLDWSHSVPQLLYWDNSMSLSFI